MVEISNWTKAGVIVGVLAIVTTLSGIFIFSPYLVEQQTKDYIKIQWTQAQIFENSKDYESAIEVYNNLLLKISKERFPFEYGQTELFLGVNYAKLSPLKNKEKNLINSINCYNEALTTLDVNKFPLVYAQTQGCIGDSYQELSTIRNSKNNLENSIRGCN